MASASEYASKRSIFDSGELIVLFDGGSKTISADEVVAAASATKSNSQYSAVLDRLSAPKAARYLIGRADSPHADVEAKAKSGYPFGSPESQLYQYLILDVARPIY